MCVLCSELLKHEPLLSHIDQTITQTRQQLPGRLSCARATQPSAEAGVNGGTQDHSHAQSPERKVQQGRPVPVPSDIVSEVKGGSETTTRVRDTKVCRGCV